MSGQVSRPPGAARYHGLERSVHRPRLKHSIVTTSSSSTPVTHLESREVGAGLPHNTETPDIETASDVYARRFRGATGAWLLEQQSRAVSALLRDTGSAPLRVLELGGGHAQLTALLLEHGHRVVVHGSAHDSLSRIRALARNCPDRVETCVANLWRLPYDERAFDMVVAFRLLGHVTRWRELLREMTRLSNRFVMVEFARSRTGVTSTLQRLLFSLKRRVEGTTRPFFIYRSEAVAAELAQQQFRLTGIAAQFAFPIVFHRLLRSPHLSGFLEESARAVGIGQRWRSPVVLLAQREPTGAVSGTGAGISHPADTARVPRVVLAGEATALENGATGI